MSGIKEISLNNTVYSIKDVNALNKQQISNCILEAPQNINLELSNGTLTLKAGSVVCVPNGFESDGTTPKFDEVTIESDITRSGLTHNAQTMTVISSSGVIQDTYPLCQFFSGTTAPTSYGYMCWYDTSTNLVKTTYNTGSTWNTGFALPIAILTESSTGITSIDQTFQSIGYIGSTIFVRKGLKGLVPNGFDSDGSLKNSEITSTKVYIRTFTNKTASSYIVFTPDRTGYPMSSLDKNLDGFYSEKTNTIENGDISGLGFYCAECTFTSGVISNFKPYTATNILKYSDSSQISGWGMPSSRYDNLTFGASGSTYTAPANGWFCVFATLSAESSWIQLSHVMTARITAGVGNDYSVILPVKKGDIIGLQYNGASLSQTWNYFRFVYAEGET